MSNIPNGVTTATLNNIEFEAGLVLKTKYTSGAFNKANVLCSTTGGIRVNVTPIRQVVKFDGVLDNTKGVERVVGYTASVQFSTKEANADMVKLAIGYSANNATTATNVDFKQGIIPDANYEGIYILGKLGNGTWRQICLSNAINVNGLQETRTDKGETLIAFDLQARYTLDDQDTPPITIEYITVAGA